jgi:hypothetical protein
MNILYTENIVALIVQVPTYIPIISATDDVFAIESNTSH